MNVSQSFAGYPFSSVLAPHGQPCVIAVESLILGLGKTGNEDTDWIYLGVSLSSHMSPHASAR